MSVLKIEISQFYWDTLKTTFFDNYEQKIIQLYILHKNNNKVYTDIIFKFNVPLNLVEINKINKMNYYDPLYLCLLKNDSYLISFSIHFINYIHNIFFKKIKI